MRGLMRRGDGEGGADFEAEGGVGGAEGGLDGGGGGGGGEEEAEVAVAFGEREEVLAGLGGDGDFADAGDGLGDVDAFDGCVDAFAGDGDHHDAGGRRGEFDGAFGAADGVAENGFF